MAKNIAIEFTASGEGKLRIRGGSFSCLGRPGLAYPRDLTVYPRNKYMSWFSAEYQVNMPYAILIWGQRGIFIHAGPPTIAGNGGSPSAGCIHLATNHAKTVFAYVDTRTRVTISYPW